MWDWERTNVSIYSGVLTKKILGLNEIDMMGKGQPGSVRRKNHTCNNSNEV